MGIGIQIGNKVDHMKSKHSEKSDVSDLQKLIVDEQDKIDLNLMEIGQFFWNLYADDPSFVPPVEAKQFFDAVEESVNIINDSEKKIEERRELGVKEREEMDIDTAKKEEEIRITKEQNREARRLEREERAAAKKKSE